MAEEDEEERKGERERNRWGEAEKREREGAEVGEERREEHARF